MRGSCFDLVPNAASQANGPSASCESSSQEHGTDLQASWIIATDVRILIREENSQDLSTYDQNRSGMGLDSHSTGVGIAIGLFLAFGLFMVFYLCRRTNGQDDLEKSKGTVSSQRHQIETLRSDLEATRTKLNEKRNTINSNRDVINRQTNELRQMASLRTNNNNLQAEVTSLNEDVQRLESANQSLRTAQDHLTRSRQEARAHVARLELFEREVTNLRSQVQDLERERGTLLRRQEESALKLRDTEQRLETLRERFQYVNEEVAERDLRLQTSLAQIESLRGGAENGVG